MDIGKVVRILEVEPEPFALPDLLDAPAEDQPKIEEPVPVEVA
jgi:hypothetical protein